MAKSLKTGSISAEAVASFREYLSNPPSHNDNLDDRGKTLSALIDHLTDELDSRKKAVAHVVSILAEHYTEATDSAFYHALVSLVFTVDHSRKVALAPHATRVLEAMDDHAVFNIDQPVQGGGYTLYKNVPTKLVGIRVAGVMNFNNYVSSHAWDYDTARYFLVPPDSNKTMTAIMVDYINIHALPENADAVLTIPVEQGVLNVGMLRDVTWSNNITNNVDMVSLMNASPDFGKDVFFKMAVNANPKVLGKVDPTVVQSALDALIVELKGSDAVHDQSILGVKLYQAVRVVLANENAFSDESLVEFFNLQLVINKIQRVLEDTKATAKRICKTNHGKTKVEDHCSLLSPKLVSLLANSNAVKGLQIPALFVATVGDFNTLVEAGAIVRNETGDEYRFVPTLDTYVKAAKFGDVPSIDAFVAAGGTEEAVIEMIETHGPTTLYKLLTPELKGNLSVVERYNVCKTALLTDYALGITEMTDLEKWMHEIQRDPRMLVLYGNLNPNQELPVHLVKVAEKAVEKIEMAMNAQRQRERLKRLLPAIGSRIPDSERPSFEGSKPLVRTTVDRYMFDNIYKHFSQQSTGFSPPYDAVDVVLRYVEEMGLYERNSKKNFMRGLAYENMHSDLMPPVAYMAMDRVGGMGKGMWPVDILGHK